MFASIVGLPYDTVLLITGIVATLATAVLMSAVVFLAWAPHASGSWASQLGVGITADEDESPATAD